MKIHRNDQVVVTTGKDRGKKGRVMRILPDAKSVLVEKINYRTVYMRRSQANPKGGISKMEHPLRVANVKLVCPRCNKPARVGYSILADRTKQRICKKCHEIL
ncbi:MAG: 50S ribosomal protein L24 [Candidatus Omnitrophota bacterium]|nr:50S ribosomal protein L24 [Candidatus Omnitrophota bacterium]